MTTIDEHGRPEPPIASGEQETLIGFLEYQRATFAWKCAGLDATGLSARVGASTMTLGGMLKHLALVEHHWFSQWLLGRDPDSRWAAADWEADPDWEWHSAGAQSPDDLRSLWNDAVEQARDCLREALADGGLDQLARRSWPDGRSPSLRWILCHMIEEYARHNGHADLLRESIDGATGE